jgi:hypothetical protein
MGAGLAGLRAAVDDAVAVPVRDLCAAELQDRIRAVARERDRLGGWVSCAAGQLAAATGGRVATEDGGDRSVAGWLAEATRTSPSVAGSRLRVSTALRDLPLVAQAVLDGVLTQEQAAVLSRLVGQIPLPDLSEVEPQLVEVAAGRDPGALAQWVRHLIATHCEPALEADEATAHDRRTLVIRQDPDGMVRGRFALAPGEGEPLLTALEPLARRQGDSDTRTAGQRRADALTELADRALRHDDDLPAHGGQRPAPVPSASSPVAVAPSAGEVRLSLSTHCGVRDAEVGGVYWAADPPLGNGNEPPGWGDPKTQGRWRQTGETTAVFLADSGVSAAFVRAERPDPYPACE